MNNYSGSFKFLFSAFLVVVVSSAAFLTQSIFPLTPMQNLASVAGNNTAAPKEININLESKNGTISLDSYSINEGPGHKNILPPESGYRIELRGIIGNNNDTDQKIDQEYFNNQHTIYSDDFSGPSPKGGVEVTNSWFGSFSFPYTSDVKKIVVYDNDGKVLLTQNVINPDDIQDVVVPPPPPPQQFSYSLGTPVITGELVSGSNDSANISIPVVINNTKAGNFVEVFVSSLVGLNYSPQEPQRFTQSGNAVFTISAKNVPVGSNTIIFGSHSLPAVAESPTQRLALNVGAPRPFSVFMANPYVTPNSNAPSFQEGTELKVFLPVHITGRTNQKIIVTCSETIHPVLLNLMNNIICFRTDGTGDINNTAVIEFTLLSYLGARDKGAHDIFFNLYVNGVKTESKHFQVSVVSPPVFSFSIGNPAPGITNLTKEITEANITVPITITNRANKRVGVHCSVASKTGSVGTVNTIPSGDVYITESKSLTFKITPSSEAVGDFDFNCAAFSDDISRPLVEKKVNSKISIVSNNPPVSPNAFDFRITRENKNIYIRQSGSAYTSLTVEPVNSSAKSPIAYKAESPNDLNVEVKPVNDTQVNVLMTLSPTSTLRGQKTFKIIASTAEGVSHDITIPINIYSPILPREFSVETRSELKIPNITKGDKYNKPAFVVYRTASTNSGTAAVVKTEVGGGLKKPTVTISKNQLMPSSNKTTPNLTISIDTTNADVGTYPLWVRFYKKGDEAQLSKSYEFFYKINVVAPAVR